MPAYADMTTKTLSFPRKRESIELVRPSLHVVEVAHWMPACAGMTEPGACAGMTKVVFVRRANTRVRPYVITPVGEHTGSPLRHHARRRTHGFAPTSSRPSANTQVRPYVITP
ncbi:MAG TPA: hypothetical protein VGL77_13520, partial [Armatimonadota bacterium]